MFNDNTTIAQFVASRAFFDLFVDDEIMYSSRIERSHAIDFCERMRVTLLRQFHDRVASHDASRERVDDDANEIATCDFRNARMSSHYARELIATIVRIVDLSRRVDSHDCIQHNMCEIVRHHMHIVVYG